MYTTTSNDDWKTIYDQVCNAHNGIADFRAKLLALLPIASGAGIFLLLNKDLDGRTMPHLVAIGIFGATVTLGLFVYELVGIHRCLTLRKCGHALEEKLLPKMHLGRFTPYPEENYLFVKVPVASLIVYAAVIGAWTYVAVIGLASVALAFIVSGFVVLFFILIAKRLRGGQDELLKTYYPELYAQGNDPNVIALKELNQRILEAEERGDRASLASLLRQDFTIVRANGEKHDRQMFLKAVENNKSRGRSADLSDVRFFGNCAIFTCRVTTTRDKDGKAAVGHFWNTRMFVQQDEGWLCLVWQVTKIGD